MTAPRTVCWFSCGAASAVATKLAIADHKEGELVVAYTAIKEEHSDNLRFLRDCERWFGVPITILRNEEYGGSIMEVFRRRRFLVGPNGAQCTHLLKKRVREDFERISDFQVFGYTSEEQRRIDRFIDMNPYVRLRLPLIERKLRKADVVAMVERAGIELPAMYRLGYRNNNCIGCVKGGAGYWNKIRRDFPERFEEMAQAEESIGHTILRLGGAPVSLRQLPPDAGREKDLDIECSIFCHMVEADMRQP